MRSSQLRAVLFDLDGTIVDSIELIVECFQIATEKHLGVPASRHEILSLIGKPLRPELERRSPEKAHDMLATYREHQFAKHDQMVRPFDGISELLFMLQDAGVILGVVTSKACRGTNAALKLFGDRVENLFSTIITVEDVEKHKPDPEPLYKALATINCPPEFACYIGDTVYDMESARDASVLPVGVTWGAGDKNSLESYTDHVFDSVTELSHFLLNKHQ